MREQRRGPWVLLLIAGGLLIVALILLYVSAPPQTTLTVRVVDADTGEPLEGASVRVRAWGEQALPIVSTDRTGVARFEDLVPDPAYVIQVQKIDYALTFRREVAVPAGERVEITVSLPALADGRLFVGLDGSRVAEIDTASLLTVQTTRLPDWKQEPVRHLRLHPTEDVLYTVGDGEGCILDGQSGAVLRQFVLEGTVEEVGLQNDGRHLFVVSQEAEDLAHLLTLDAITGELLSSTPVVPPRQATQLVWVPEARRTYVLELSRRALWVLDFGAQQVLERIPAGAYPKEGFLSADGQYLYTWSEAQLEDLQGMFGSELKPVLEGQPVPDSGLAWALSPTGQNLYMLDAQLGTLSIIDLVGQAPPTLVAVGKEPDAVVVSMDGQWAYVANRGSRTISAIYLPASSVVSTIPVLGEPFSLALRPASNQE